MLGRGVPAMRHLWDIRGISVLSVLSVCEILRCILRRMSVALKGV